MQVKTSTKKPNARMSATARWAAVTQRDRSRDGQFFYSVETTGVFCRPSCGARLPKRENVKFHDTAHDAAAAGFRACKRCKPEDPLADRRYKNMVAGACRAIEASDETVSLDVLARSAGFSPFHFHRMFKSITGVTPKAYGLEVRKNRVRAGLKKERKVIDAIFDAGFTSNARFYETSAMLLGMTPSAYKSGGKGEVILFAIGRCSLGAILVAESAKGVCAVLLGDEPEPLLNDLQVRFSKAELIGGDAPFEKRAANVIAAVDSPQMKVDLPLDIRGTAFQHRVWKALTEIPAGQTASYSSIAKKIGRPKSVRAVASACGANPMAVIVPCHRVVRNDGALSGYRWGLERKAALLKREKARTTKPAQDWPRK